MDIGRFLCSRSTGLDLLHLAEQENMYDQDFLFCTYLTLSHTGLCQDVVLDVEDNQPTKHDYDEASKYVWTGNVGRVTGEAACALLVHQNHCISQTVTNHRE